MVRERKGKKAGGESNVSSTLSQDVTSEGWAKRGSLQQSFQATRERLKRGLKASTECLNGSR